MAGLHAAGSVVRGLAFYGFPKESPPMALEKEWIDRSEAIRAAILQLRDSL